MASVKVAVRLRPMNRREKDLEAKCIIIMERNKTSITNIKIPEGMSGDSARERTKTFTYDFSYDSTDCKHSSYVSQEKVFNDLGTDVLKSAFEGYNACVFAYGQTGSGKSYTMMGNPGDSGLIPRICEGLFSRISGMSRRDEASFRTEVSYLEIYNERVRDLLRRKSSKTYNLRVREHPKDGPYVEDLSKHLVQNYSDVEELMEAGNINRTTASTGMNDVSSRSHAIFTINFTQAKFDAEMPCETVSKIHLVDLAGSERADATGATGVRLKEGGNINKSLVTLGNVISALADLSQDSAISHSKKKQVFVPYRDSVLTWLLKDSLGGNSKTIMVATISPADVNYGETLSTLRYANRAKNIINKPTINEDSNVKLIRELRAEIARLKALLAQGNQIALLDSPTALSMEEKLHQNEARVIELTKEWTNKWNETQNILKEETLALRKEGIGVVLDSELPHLIGIDDDLLSTGIILYHLKEGRTYVGRDDAATEQDIVLHGLDLESEHCVFENLNGTVTLIPLNMAQCSVNGIQIEEPTQLNQGAVLLLGRTNMFRFNHPKEAAKLREKRKSGLLSSFSLSMTDLSKSCENLSAVMLYNPGLEFERQQREELEKLENKRKLIKEMEEKQKCEKAELERMQQEVESQRKESEQVQLRIKRQEESLKRRSLDIESRLKDLLAEKERFEEERLKEQQEIELKKKKQEEEIHIRVQKEQQKLQEIHTKEMREKMQIFRELEKLKRERDEQSSKLEQEKKRLEEQEKEQLTLVYRLEEQLREKQEMIGLLKRDDAQRMQQEKHVLEEIREVLLKVKESSPDGDEEQEDVRNAQQKYMNFKLQQLEQLSQIEEELKQQKEQLEKDIVSEQKALSIQRERLATSDVPISVQEKDKIRLAEQRLHCKERQLHSLTENHLPATVEEKVRTAEIVDKGLFGLDNTLYQIEKEIEEKAEQLTLYCANSDHLQQLQETYEFTANVARQEEKVRKKEKEILESKEKQQREALEQAVAKLERRHSALQRQSTIELEIEEQKRKLSALKGSNQEAGLHASLEAEHKAQEEDRARLERGIQELKQKICESDCGLKSCLATCDDKPSPASSPNGTPSTPKTPQSKLIGLADDGINAYIEQEVQRRLQQLSQVNGDNCAIDLSFSHEDGNTQEDEKSPNGCDPRKLKYETNESHVPKLQVLCIPEEAAAFLEVTEEQERTNLLSESHCFMRSEDVFMSQKVMTSSHSVHPQLLLPCNTGSNEIHFPEELLMSSVKPLDSLSVQEEETKEQYNSCNCAKRQNGSSMGDQPTEAFLHISSNRIMFQNLGLEKPDVHRPTEKAHWEQITSREMLLKDRSEHKVLENNLGLRIVEATGLGSVVSQVSRAYGDTRRHLRNSRKFLSQLREGRWWNSALSGFPFVQRMQFEVSMTQNIHVSELAVRSKSCTSIPELSISGALSPVTLPGRESLHYRGRSSVSMYKIGECQVLHQRLITFPPELQKLQCLPLYRLLEHLTFIAPGVVESQAHLHQVCWLAAANCKCPWPQAACIIFSCSTVLAIISNPEPVFHVLPLQNIQEIQVGFAGQNVRILGSTEDTILTIFTYNKHLTQVLCRTLLKMLTCFDDESPSLNHALLREDLQQLSRTWNFETPDLILSSGVRLSCKFTKSLADLVCMLHANMSGKKPPLGHVNILFYVSMVVEIAASSDLMSFVLTDTHIGVIQEDSVFYPIPTTMSLHPKRPQFEKTLLRHRADLRCVFMTTEFNLPKLELFFGRKEDTDQTVSWLVNTPPSTDNLSDLEVWKLTIGTAEEASFLINNLLGVQEQVSKK
ncbi:kinesin-like protein KIF16B isoform X2 [Polypterus senegalus]|uniref:kinesin-like protein KIF16B isoform X2 n=1 Tax=Polypterus senegalus TaxID=55291 RepID=UPI0019647F97|nr:kinesin-like protein KIF16B isoform X2 [Polypterus senegalus]